MTSSNRKTIRLAILLATTAMFGVAASASESSEPSSKGTATGGDEGKIRLIDGATKPKTAPAPADAMDPWHHAKEVERQSQTRMRRAAIALQLIEERLKTLIDAESKRTSELAEQKALETTREQMLQKLAGVYVKMKVQQAGQVLEEFDPAIAADVLALMPPKRAAKIVAAMKPKRAAQLLSRWTVEDR